MDPEQKKRIIKRYLEQISTSETVISDEDIEDIPFYTELGEALEALEQTHNRLLDFENVETDEVKWGRLSAVLKSGLTLHPDAPGLITALDLEKMKKGARDIEDSLLPKLDYYTRITTPNDDCQENTIVPLITASQDKLGLLLAKVTGIDFDKTNNEHVKSLIEELQEAIEEAKKTNNPGKEEFLQKYLIVAEDLLKINQLEAITIPDEQGGSSTYCSLAEAAGGVTEKVSLVSLATVTSQLGGLRDTDVSSIDDYLNNRGDYKLSTEGILKLPKHGNIEEVQREAMALNLSRTLGLDTTRSSMVSHDGKPALFVPFDNIKLMSEFAQGKTFEAFEPLKKEKKTYQHYSTLNPLGSGLQSNRYIDDFGDSFALFYACSDPDSVGGYNQNKALRNNRSLYIFDQIIMPSDKMKLDSRLSLQPDEFIKKHTRHGQGRNRTLIEDASLTAKFESLKRLLAQRDRIYAIATATADRHQREIERLEGLLSNPHLNEKGRQALGEQKKQVTALKKDAIDIRNAIINRIDKIYSVLPKIREGQQHRISMEHMKQALVLEKLLHNPSLFTDDGRPYKNPWTYRQGNPVKTMELLPNGHFLLKFDSKLSTKMLDFIKRHGGDSIGLHSSKGIEISEKKLLSLRETMLHPESQMQMQRGVNYLKFDDLNQIGMAYGKGHRTRILNLLDNYIGVMSKPTYNQEQKLSAIRNVAIRLQRYINTAQDKGFGMHVLKKLHFDIQQRLQKMIPSKDKPEHLDEAFSAALKLDRVDMFNKVMAEAIRHNRVNSLDFQDFLQTCIDEAAQASNHIEAVEASNTIHELGKELIEIFQIPVQPLENINDNDLYEVNPENIRKGELVEGSELRKTIDKRPSDSQINTDRLKEDEIQQIPVVGVRSK